MPEIKRVIWFGFLQILVVNFADFSCKQKFTNGFSFQGFTNEQF